jgi:hypothetical protein
MAPDSAIGPLEELAHLAHQRERRQRARVASGAAGHQDQTVDARFQRLLGVADRNHVMHDDAAVAVDRVQHLLRRRAQRRDDDRDLVLDADFDVVREAVVRLMDDLVDGDRADALVRIGRLVVGQFLLQVGQPDIQHFRRARVQRREGADDAGLALGGDELAAAGDEHRGGDDGK